MEFKKAIAKMDRFIDKYKKFIVVLMLSVNTIAFLAAYKTYINIAMELSQPQAVVYPYCASVALISGIGMVFYLLGKKTLGEFIELVSTSGLIFFGFIAIALQFVYGSNLNLFSFSQIGWFLIHFFMWYEGFFFIRETELEDGILFPLTLGAVILVIFIAGSKDILDLILFWFFKITTGTGASFN